MGWELAHITTVSLTVSLKATVRGEVEEEEGQREKRTSTDQQHVLAALPHPLSIHPSFAAAPAPGPDGCVDDSASGIRCPIAAMT